VREGDSELSSHFVNIFVIGQITKGEWDKANECRIYLKVLTVRDIASEDGKYIDDGIQKGKYNSSRARKRDWPIQGRPKKTDW